MPCVVCEEPVTNPVCPCCLQDSVQEWIQYAAPDLMKEFKLVSSELTCVKGNIGCIKCSKTVGICPYCYTRHLNDWLSEDQELQSEFLEFFNFDLWHSGYSQGA